MLSLKRRISLISGRDNPYFDKESRQYVFEGAGDFELFGFAFDPNAIEQDVFISASLYKQGETTATFVRSLQVGGDSEFKGQGQFSINETLPEEGQYFVKIQAMGNTNSEVDQTISLSFEVPLPSRKREFSFRAVNSFSSKFVRRTPKY